MGAIVKKIVGDHSVDPDFKEFTMEDNADSKVHVHMGYIRLDMYREDYNRFYDGMMRSYDILKERHGWDD